MGFQKKGAAKTVQAKKKVKQAFEVEEDEIDMLDMAGSEDDEDDNSEEEMEVLKTPANKTPKGRQSMGENRVSFNLSGKNKNTPKRDTSLSTKKQPTPAAKGRASLPEFKGTDQSKTPQKGNDSEDGDDDDDLDIDEEDDDSDDLDIDEEEDDEENEEPVKNAKGQKKNTDQNNLQNKQKSPVKGVDKSKDIKNNPNTAQAAKAGQTPNKEMKKETLTMAEVLKVEEEKKRQRNLTRLYLGKLPSDVTTEEIKTLSADILHVEIPCFNVKKTQHRASVAFLIFADEAMTEKNYKLLQTKKFRGQPLTVDFVGQKSQLKITKSKEEKQYDPRKLIVSRLPLEATLDDIAKFFPNRIALKKSSNCGSVYVKYRTEDAMLADYMAAQDIELDGHKLAAYLCQLRKTKSGGDKRNCYNCGKDGHIARDCPTKSGDSYQSRSGFSDREPYRAKSNYDRPFERNDRFDRNDHFDRNDRFERNGDRFERNDFGSPNNDREYGGRDQDRRGNDGGYGFSDRGMNRGGAGRMAAWDGGMDFKDSGYGWREEGGRDSRYRESSDRDIPPRDGGYDRRSDDRPSYDADTSQWNGFFRKAGLPANVAANYAIIFSKNRIQVGMLLDLSKEYLYDMGIKVMGDVIAILKYSKEFHNQLTKGNPSVITNKAAGGGDKRNCYNCGKDGHIARDCPTKSEGGGDKRNCYNCGKDGHISRDCPTKSGAKRGGNTNGLPPAKKIKTTQFVEGEKLFENH